MVIPFFKNFSGPLALLSPGFPSISQLLYLFCFYIQYSVNGSQVPKIPESQFIIPFNNITLYIQLVIASWSDTLLNAFFDLRLLTQNSLTCVILNQSYMRNSLASMRASSYLPARFVFLQFILDVATRHIFIKCTYFLNEHLIVSLYFVCVCSHWCDFCYFIIS